MTKKSKADEQVVRDEQDAEIREEARQAAGDKRFDEACKARDAAEAPIIRGGAEKIEVARKELDAAGWTPPQRSWWQQFKDWLGI